MEGDRDLDSSGSAAQTRSTHEAGNDAHGAEENTHHNKREWRHEARARIHSRRRPSTRLIDGSRSAAGSAFYAYCFEEEMTLRRKNIDWGRGPDLVIVEFGVNDVWPGGEQAMRDFERLLRTLKTLPSRPAVIALEAPSLLLASTAGAHASPEYLHLPAAHFYDVPVLSARNAVFKPRGLPMGTAGTAPLTELFLPDLHHPNERGHALLADVLLEYLSVQACRAQTELLAATQARLSRTSTPRQRSQAIALPDTMPQAVDPLLDFARRSNEEPPPIPNRSLFQPLFYTKKKGKTAPKPPNPWKMPPAHCAQIGNAKSKVAPIRKKGYIPVSTKAQGSTPAHELSRRWKKMSWSRDKQYLVADTPGATVTYSVSVGSGGAILADWLRSRSYGLGDVLVCEYRLSGAMRAFPPLSIPRPVASDLDHDRSQSVQISGYQDFGWSIGVPTELFRDVRPGTHDITFELLPAKESSHPEKETNFRLISIIST